MDSVKPPYYYDGCVKFFIKLFKLGNYLNYARTRVCVNRDSILYTHCAIAYTEDNVPLSC